MKNYRYVLTLAAVALFVFACSEKTESTDPESVMVKQEEPSAIKMQNLMKETLALAENVEVIMSVVELPKIRAFLCIFTLGKSSLISWKVPGRY